MSAIIARSLAFTCVASLKPMVEVDSAAPTAMHSASFRNAIFPAFVEGSTSAGGGSRSVTSPISPADLASILRMCPLVELVRRIGLVFSDNTDRSVLAALLVKLPQLHYVRIAFRQEIEYQTSPGDIMVMSDAFLALPHLETLAFNPNSSNASSFFTSLGSILFRLLREHRNERLRINILEQLHHFFSNENITVIKSEREAAARSLVEYCDIVPLIVSALEATLQRRTTESHAEHQKQLPLLARSSNPPKLWEHLLGLLRWLLTHVPPSTIKLADIKPVLVPELLQFGHEFPKVQRNAMWVFSAAGDKREDIQLWLRDSGLVQSLIKTELQQLLQDVGVVDNSMSNNGRGNNDGKIGSLYPCLRVLGNFTVINAELSKLLIEWDMLPLLRRILLLLGVRPAVAASSSPSSSSSSPRRSGFVPIVWSRLQLDLAQEAAWILSNLAIDCHAEIRAADDIFGLLVALAVDPVDRKSQKEASIAVQNLLFVDPAGGGAAGQDIKTVYEQNVTRLRGLGLIEDMLDEIRAYFFVGKIPFPAPAMHGSILPSFTGASMHVAQPTNRDILNAARLRQRVGPSTPVPTLPPALMRRFRGMVDSMLQTEYMHFAHVQNMSVQNLQTPVSMAFSPMRATPDAVAWLGEKDFFQALHLLLSEPDACWLLVAADGVPDKTLDITVGSIYNHLRCQDESFAQAMVGCYNRLQDENARLTAENASLRAALELLGGSV